MSVSKVDTEGNSQKSKGGRPKGTRKTGGRQKGTRNKRTSELTELLEKQFPGYDPVVQLAGFANDEANELALRAQCAKEVAKYVRPQLKAIEHSTQAGGMNIVWSTGVPDADADS